MRFSVSLLGIFIAIARAGVMSGLMWYTFMGIYVWKNWSKYWYWYALAFVGALFATII